MSTSHSSTPVSRSRHARRFGPGRRLLAACGVSLLSCGGMYVMTWSPLLEVPATLYVFQCTIMTGLLLGSVVTPRARYRLARLLWSQRRYFEAWASVSRPAYFRPASPAAMRRAYRLAAEAARTPVAPPDTGSMHPYRAPAAVPAPGPGTTARPGLLERLLTDVALALADWVSMGALSSRPGLVRRGAWPYRRVSPPTPGSSRR